MENQPPDFLWKVSLKILNFGLILKTFTQALHNRIAFQMIEYKQNTSQLPVSQIICLAVKLFTATLVWCCAPVGGFMAVKP